MWLQLVCLSVLLAMASFGLMVFVQYSYPTLVHGKMFGIFVLVSALGAFVLPLINEIKKDFQIGWDSYRKLMVAVSSGSVLLTLMLVLLAFDKE